MNDKVALRLSENAHLPFDKLGALSKVEGLMALSKAEGPFGRPFDSLVRNELACNC